MTGIFRQDFNSLPDGFDNRRANENHLDRFFAQLGLAKVDIAGQLPPVSIAENADVEQPERFLRRAVYLASQQNRSGTSSEKRSDRKSVV